MKRPDAVFTVTVHPAFRLDPCPAMLDEQRRGLFGFHQFHSCPACKLSGDGWQMWGENGHQQGTAPTRERLAHWLKVTARRQWRITVGPLAGSLMGYHFRVGHRIYFR